MTPSLGSAGSREYFVPRGETRLFAVNRCHQLFVEAAGELTHGIASNKFEQSFFKSNGCAFRLILGFPQPACPLAKDPRILTRRLRSRFFNQLGSQQQLNRDGLSGSDSFHKIDVPGFETIDPAFHGVVIPAKLLDAKLATPAIVAERLHRRCLEFLLVLPVQDLTGDLVMTVGEHISFDNHAFANDALDWKSPAIDLRRNPLDYDPLSSVHLLFRHSS